MQKKDFNNNWILKDKNGNVKHVTLPYDAMIHEIRKPDCPSESGGAFFPGGIYEYEKSFEIPIEWASMSVTFQFEGVYKNSKVYINDREVGGCAYGYSQFYVNADGALHYGKNNTIRVIVDNTKMPNSRWYTGTGIYRPVWMLVSEQSHIELNGVQITTLSHNPALIRITTVHTGGERVFVEVLDDGDVVAKGNGNILELSIPKAKLWSDKSPNLYQCRVALLDNDVIVDEIIETFGIRLIEWSNKGLFVNGQETLLRGGCIHHDNGILGASSYRKSEERRVRMLKEAGFNAIRSAHNPASIAMLEACDRYGIYVMDETWDMWYNHKNKFDYASDFEANYKSDIKTLVERDYNHPSVIMYSIGNEVSEPATKKGQDLTREMVSFIHSLDQSRPVTAGINLMIIYRSAQGKSIYKEDGGLSSEDQTKNTNMNSTMFNMLASVVGTGMNKGANSKKADTITTPCLDALDIAGYNYASGRYPLEGKAHPNRIIVGAETFPQDIVKNWNMVKKFPYLIGDFMWTAWDYLGESGIGAWSYTQDGRGFSKPYPWLLADVGALDLLGNPNGEMFLAQAAWNLLEKPVIAVQPVNHPGVKPAKAVWRGTNAMPSWAWKGCEGNKAVVEVYTNAYEVELLLNSKRIGKKRVKGCMAKFRIKYAPNKLEAVSFDKHGYELSRSELYPATGKISIRVTPEESTIIAGDIVYIKVEMVGENGVIECNSDVKLNVFVEGGELLAFGSANPRTLENYDEGSFTTYYGKAQAVVRSNDIGTISVTVTGNGMSPTTTHITVI
ncbi:glycoside hydrolase family 2 TIM barrel-domain containing protein [Paenibacillus segetis]|uniref:Beta-galactosidase n=1 Tax=Paenibacillus segetis TaxID=1325360 RepID=A0ABQ1YQT8_9BACL|nr:glycoside hydrolase family 2 TIM barrel-domain containing protein [Paenibacillus segetis]GGH35266.1 beta-galactosidase [Paenibacillus segetis]